MPRRKGASLSDQIGQLRGIAQSMTPSSPPAANRVRRATGEGARPALPAIRRATGEGVRGKMAPNLVEPETMAAARAEAQMRQVQGQAQARARARQRRMKM